MNDSELVDNGVL